ncbi:hypothetical protein BJY00DRAFT_175637 [Aspergillus carlsbadensis]|nr:hypothetical protein BJY00DRAFT_175637 [Aspergillus carlsbadensis]
MQPETIIISNSHDFRVRVNEYESVWNDKGKRTRASTPKRSAVFLVEKSKLVASSDCFYDMFASSKRMEASVDEITLQEENVMAMGVLFHCVHKQLRETSPMPTPITAKSVAMEGVWHLAGACEKYHIDMKMPAVRGWFAAWYEAHKYDKGFHSEAMFPSYCFNYAAGFQVSTRHLVYNSYQHISEHNPTKEDKLHLPPRVIQQLNNARGRLRHVLHTNLDKDIRSLLRRDSCTCRKETHYNYHRELDRIEVEPLAITTRSYTINRLLGRLEEFNATNVRPANATVCVACDKNWGAIIRNAIAEVTKYFDGLCLDCMNVSALLDHGRDPDHEYWHPLRGLWDINCRIKHGDATYYFSCMGRREKKTLISW